MNIKDQILDIAKKQKVFKASDVMEKIPDMSRQYISRVISELYSDGALLREGSVRWSTYALPEHRDLLAHRLRRRLLLEGLKEHEVLDDIMRVSVLLKKVPENIRSIFNYAFSEMLNNAIDHSQSHDCVIEVIEEDDRLKFVVDDFGVGVFKNVMNERGLKSELEAIQDLLKGKTTTLPQAHSGEGIFFTSKAADIFTLESFGLRLRIDNTLPDIFIEKMDRQKTGTRVTFEVSTKSKKHLTDLFAKYQTSMENPAFDKTEIKIKLYIMGTVYVSRSQARRVLAGLERFSTIILDFENVPTIGQAFADEIFRVFKNAYPEISIQHINANEAVDFMIARAISTK